MNTILFAADADAWLLAGWTMVHFLWLGTLVAAAAFVCRLLLRRASANLRYAIALTSLAVLAVLPLAIAISMSPLPPGEGQGEGALFRQPPATSKSTNLAPPPLSVGGHAESTAANLTPHLLAPAKPITQPSPPLASNVPTTPSPPAPRASQLPPPPPAPSPQPLDSPPSSPISPGSGSSAPPSPSSSPPPASSAPAASAAPADRLPMDLSPNC